MAISNTKHLIFPALLCVGLAACGDDSDNNNDQSGNPDDNCCTQTADIEDGQVVSNKDGTLTTHDTGTVLQVTDSGAQEYSPGDIVHVTSEGGNTITSGTQSPLVFNKLFEGADVTAYLRVTDGDPEVIRLTFSEDKTFTLDVQELGDQSAPIPDLDGVEHDYEVTANGNLLLTWKANVSFGPINWANSTSTHIVISSEASGGTYYAMGCTNDPAPGEADTCTDQIDGLQITLSPTDVVDGATNPSLIGNYYPFTEEELRGQTLYGVGVAGSAGNQFPVEVKIGFSDSDNTFTLSIDGVEQNFDDTYSISDQGVLSLQASNGSELRGTNITRVYVQDPTKPLVFTACGSASEGITVTCSILGVTDGDGDPDTEIYVFPSERDAADALKLLTDTYSG